MNITRWALLGAAAFLLGDARVGALTEFLTDRDYAYAISIANGSEGTRRLFHAPYALVVNDPTIERLEIITEFRRFVLAAEDQLKAGNWMLARGGYDPKGRTLRDLLRPLEGQVSVRARLRFHPHNAYVTLPPFDILVGEPTLLAINTIRTPHVTPASGDRGTRDVIDGATIEVFYNAPTITNRTLPIRMFFEGKELTRVGVDFSRIQ